MISGGDAKNSVLRHRNTHLLNTCTVLILYIRAQICWSIQNLFISIN